jgi:hypothetical protein
MTTNDFKQALDLEIGEMKLDPRTVGRAISVGRARQSRRKFAVTAGFFAAVAASAMLFVHLYDQAGKNPALSPSQTVSAPTGAASPSPSPAVPIDAGGLTRFYSGGKVGFKDAGGDIVIAADFRYATDFNSDGVAVVAQTEDGKLALLGPEGLRTGYDFDDVGVFSDGLSTVKVGERYGYINAAGSLAIKPQLIKARAFSRGLAAVAIKAEGDRWENWGFIDKNGHFAVQPQYRSVSDFAEDGTATVSILTQATQDEPSGEILSGLVDSQGNILFPLEYRGLSRAWQGIRVASMGARDSASGMRKQGLINANGNWIVEPQYIEMGVIQNGLVTASVVKKGQQYTGILRMDGTWLYEPVHQSVFGHKYGLIVFSDRTSADDLGTMVLYGENGGRLLGGKAFHRIDIVSPGLVCCLTMNKSGATVSSKLLKTDGTPPVPGTEIAGGYEVCEGYVAADAGTAGDAYGFKDEVGNWRNSYGILGESGWAVEPKYNQILQFDGKSGRGVRIVPELSAGERIAYVFESFDAAGNATGCSDVEYGSEAEYTARMYTERNYNTGGRAINRLSPGA